MIEVDFKIDDGAGGGGFAVPTTGHGEDAWFLADIEDYDLIVLDLGLPTMAACGA